MNLIILLMVTGACARHVQDGHGGLSETDIGLNKHVDKHSDDGGNQFAEPKIESDRDYFNNISEENDYRLRTNAYTTEAYYTTERINQGAKVYTNNRDVKYNEERINHDQNNNRGQRIYSGRLVPTGLVPETKQINKPKVNKHIHKPTPDTFVNQQPERNIETNVKPIHNRPEDRNGRIPVRTNFDKPIHNLKTNAANNPVLEPQPANNTNQSEGRAHETVVVNPIYEGRNDTEDDPTPRRNETDITDDVQIWVWGTERTTLSTTEPGSLDDRAAFSGDKCPTGKAKINGVCVEKD